MNLVRRIQALEAKRPEHGGRVMVMIVRDDAPEPDALYYGSQTFTRAEGETYDTFTTRCLASADGPAAGPLVFMACNLGEVNQ